MKTSRIIISAIAAVSLFVSCESQKDGVYVKPRVIVTCDPELDDNNSLIRYVLHANDFQTEAIVYNASRFHWRGDGKGTTQFIPGSEYANMGLGPQTSWRYKWDERFIDDIIDAYGQCYENLKVHDPSYPTYEELKSKIRVGNVDFEGEMDHDTPGSELIKEIMLDDKPGKVFCQAWGGSSSIARALKSIEEEYKGTDKWDAIYKKLCDKLVLCFSGDQDGCYVNYIAIDWPDLRIQTTGGKMSRYDNSVYNYQSSPEYTAQNITIGPLGALVRVWGDENRWSRVTLQTSSDLQASIPRKNLRNRATLSGVLSSLRAHGMATATAAATSISLTTVSALGKMTHGADGQDVVNSALRTANTPTWVPISTSRPRKPMPRNLTLQEWQY